MSEGRNGKKKMSDINSYCDGSKCKAAGEVRVLSTGENSNAILCLDCFRYEMKHRVKRNRDLSKDAQFDILKWSDVKAYPFQSEFARGEMNEFNRIVTLLENRAKDADTVQAVGYATTLRGLIQDLGE